MYCPECGTETTDDAAFCPECGTDLGPPPGTDPGGTQQRTSTSAQQVHAQGTQTQAEHSSGERADPSLTDGVSIAGGLFRGLGTFISAFTLIAMVLGYEVWTSITSATSTATTAGSASLEQMAGVLSAGVVVGGSAVAGNVVVVIVKLVGWIFFNAHQVPITGTGTATTTSGAQTTAGSVNILSQLGQLPNPPLTPMFYYVIPPILLAYGGYRLSSRGGVTSPVPGLLPGASIALGYVPVAFAFATFASISPRVTASTATASASVGPDPVMAALMAGGYAVVCGALGGGLAGLVNE